MIYTRSFSGEPPNVEGFSEEAERTLAICEEMLEWLVPEPAPDGYAAVMRFLDEIDHLPMTPYQRARLLGCRVEATYFLDDWELALRLVDEAIYLASELEVAEGREAMIERLSGELLRRKAEILRRRADILGAAETYGQSVGHLWRAAEIEGWVSTGSLRDSLGRCVGQELELGRDEQAEIHLDMAEQALRQTRLEERGATEDAVTQWMRATVNHRKGRLEFALVNATRAADAFMATGPDNSAARILWVTVEILLDLAESYGPGSTAQGDYLRSAHTYHRLMVEHAQRGGDKAGLAMATLVEVRLNRLARSGYRMGTTRLRALLERRTLEHEWDWATLSLGRVALGKELLARVARLEEKGGPANLQQANEMREEARSELEFAVAEARKHSAPGMTWWAVRWLETLA